MVGETNGTLYMNNPPAKEGFFETAATIDGDYTIADNAVIAGPTTFHWNSYSHRNIGNRMSKINVNTWEPESGTAATLMASGDTVTVPSGATLAIASGATIANSGTATGMGDDAVKVLSKAADYTILPADVSGVGTLYVLVDASAATRTITLPTPANYSGVVIKVVASVAPGTGYSVIVNNSGASEIWTCYAIGDFYTGVSDGTSNIKADGRVSVYGKMYQSTNLTPSGIAYWKTTYNTMDYNIGGWGDLANNRINVGFDCIISVQSAINVENPGNMAIYVDSANWTDNYTSTEMGYSPTVRNLSFCQKVLASENTC